MESTANDSINEFSDVVPELHQASSTPVTRLRSGGGLNVLPNVQITPLEYKF